MTKVAVIGAGLSGLVVAHGLRDRAEVVVFEKSRGPGGRMATRYAGDYAFDHGAQFFTARTAAFRAFLQPLIAAGVVKSWPARFVELDRDRVTAMRDWSDEQPHFVGTPGMNSIGKHLAASLSVATDTRVTRVERSRKGWLLTDAEGRDLGRFDWLVMTMPAPQTADLCSANPALAAE